MAVIGIVVVDKPSGWTSHQVVGRVRRLLGTRKVGHAGTLDPMATGVLLIGVERATRLLGYLAASDKTYTATIRLGQRTDTDDAEGEVVESEGARGISPDAVETAMQALRGDIEQVPSTYSAIKVAGQRAYALARRGEQVQLKSRPVRVTRFEVTERRDAEADGVNVVDLDVLVDCSTGTYIRALARDLGAALGTGGHLTALRRTRVSGFTLDQATLDADGLAADAPPSVLPMIEAVRRSLPVVAVTESQARAVRYGQALDLELSDDPTALVHDGDVLALYRPDGARAVPVAVFV